MADAALKGLNCRQCGAPLALRAGAHTKTVVCPSCLTLADPTDPSVRILQDAARGERRTPLVPLGTRGALEEGVFEVIGYQYRTITVDDVQYGWEEYLLFNPYRGFRYLTQYDGHWNLVRAVAELPRATGRTALSSRRWDGSAFRHFQTARATTRFVLGEFPWRVRAGETVTTSDFVAPPRLLSREAARSETTWSVGTYATGDRVWQWFSLPGSPPPAIGIFANQPSPYAGKPGRYWRTAAVLALLVLLVLGLRFALSGREVYRTTLRFDPAASRDAALVTDPFELAGRTSNVAVELDADVSNAWVYFSLALIDERTGVALDTGREISYYSGVEDGDAWTEGSRRARVVFPDVAAGPHYLRIEPEAPEVRAPFAYRVRVVRDVPSLVSFVGALVLLLVPPVLVTWRAMAFESRRWAEGGGDGEARDDADSDDD